jgi:hypothetical protein
MTIALRRPVGRAEIRTFAGEFRSKLEERRRAAPEVPTLLHKRGGHWRVFSWSEVAAEVDRLMMRLTEDGLDNRARLAMSGAFEPDLIFVAVAAHLLGADIYPVNGATRADELSRTLKTIAPTHAFVQGRRKITRWLATEPPTRVLTTLYTSLPMASHEGLWRLTALWPEPDDQPTNLKISRRSALGQRSIRWVDEGTEWSGGLAEIIEVWLTGETVIAFPESGESTTRDRREIPLTSLLASETRRSRLGQELSHRLPPDGTWRRRICDFAKANPDGLLGRVVNARLAYLLGLPQRP